MLQSMMLMALLFPNFQTPKNPVEQCVQACMADNDRPSYELKACINRCYQAGR